MIRLGRCLVRHDAAFPYVTSLTGHQVSGELRGRQEQGRYFSELLKTAFSWWGGVHKPRIPQVRGTQKSAQL